MRVDSVYLATLGYGSEARRKLYTKDDDPKQVVLPSSEEKLLERRAFEVCSSTASSVPAMTTFPRKGK
jgi:hypothetical protein